MANAYLACRSVSAPDRPAFCSRLLFRGSARAGLSTPPGSTTRRPSPPAATRSSRAARSARWRSRRRQAPLRRQHARQPARDLPRRRTAASTHRGSVPVGLEPVAVAARSDDEVWVVNHLSDSVSIVELDDARRRRGRVVRTLLVGDEPRDIVFAGPGSSRAFITTAHRGQNVPVRSRSSRRRASAAPTSGSSTPTSLGSVRSAARRSPSSRCSADTPRALAVTPDGSRVYAAGFHSGNRTTTRHEASRARRRLRRPDGVPGPERPTPPGDPGARGRAHRQVRTARTGSTSSAATGTTQVRFTLPDKDVFAIDAMANPPRAVAGPAGFFAASAPSSSTWRSTR